MRKLFLSVLMTALLMTLVSGFVMAEYTPLPGVKSPEEVDFGGKTVYIRTNKTLREDSKHFGPGGEREGRLAKAEKLFNCEIKDQPELEEGLFERIMSGDATNEVYLVGNNGNLFYFLANGAFYPVGELLPDEYYEKLPPFSEFTDKKITFKGTKYFFGTAKYDFAEVMGIRYNSKMLESEGLPDIWNLYEQGKWTFEKMEELMRDATRDTNGDGDIDQYGLNQKFVWWTLRSMLLSSKNGAFMVKDENGNYKFNWNTEEPIKILDIVQDWYEDGLIATIGEHFPGSDPTYKKGNALMSIDTHAKPPEDGESKMAPLPRLSSAEEHSFPIWSTSTWALPATAENPEGLIALVEYLYRPDDKTDPGLGTKFEFIKNNFPNSQAAKFVELAANKFDGDIWLYRDLWDTVVDVKSAESAVRDILVDDLPPKATLDELAPKLQGQIDELFGQ